MVEVDLRGRYVPHATQLPFHVDAGTVKFRGLFGGTGSGKSLAGIAEDVYWCVRHAGIVGYVFEPTYKMIDRIVVPTLNVILGSPFWESPLVADFNRGRMNIRFFNGSVLWLVSLDDPEQAEGGNIDFAHADEARLVKPERKWEVAWRVIQRRLRGSAGDRYPIGAWVTTTPNAPGSSLYNFFENPKTKNPEAKVYRVHLDDNAENLPGGFIEGIKREHTGSLYKRFVEGLFAGDETATFPFDYSVHVQQFQPPLYGDVSYGVDFGWSEPAAIVVVLFDGDRRAHVVDEMYETRLSDSDVAERCLEMQGKWGDGDFWCDPSAPDTIDYLRRQGLKARKGNRKRDEGVREIGGRLKDAGDGRRRLYVSDSCVNLIDELQGYSEDRKGYDHGVDALRYCLMGNIYGPGKANFAFGPPLGWDKPRKR